ncbi:hypothetical protein SAMN05421820_1091 [Pedobacter steynii]|uniref:Putative auto-transporter adhesin head GIN domain-containing protein n=1 Tax=Pedobacter steynii TaxID=430522 RepID=A0A1H0DHE9_9SPHI|nr:DUF2807 domain-containing protein [Pedobacter steynii]NQX41738.1 DUF2807 domain-containing protein [Pedobacter steynii]SDN69504.1 hypothetical protein SAMN05421820_1091 [Pedobacter steynii]
MKTSFKSLLALTLTAIVLSTSAFTSLAVAADKNPSGMLAPLTAFNKIVVTGNVKLTLVQKSKQDITVDSEFDQNKTSFKQKGYTLFINSTASETLYVTVFVTDLQRIDASQGARVATVGNFNLEVLQVFLQDNATASVKGTINSLYTVTKDNSDLKLAGTANQHIIVKNRNSILDTEKFAALKTEMTSLEAGIAANTKTVLVK